jgi:hypothetical protein
MCSETQGLSEPNAIISDDIGDTKQQKNVEKGEN